MDSIDLNGHGYGVARSPNYEETSAVCDTIKRQVSMSLFRANLTALCALALIAALALVGACAGPEPTVAVSARATPTPLPTATPTAMPTATPTSTPAPVPTATPTQTPTPTPTMTPTATATGTPVPADTPTPTLTPTPVPPPTMTPTPGPPPSSDAPLPGFTPFPPDPTQTPTPVPPPTPTVVPFESFASMHGGSTHTCGLRPNGAVLCWGGNEHRQASPPPNIRLASLSTSYNHNCGLQDNGIAVCWGAAGLGSQTYTITSTRALATTAGTSTGELRSNGQSLDFAVPANLTGSLTFTIAVHPVYNHNELGRKTFSLPATLGTVGIAQTWTVDSGALGSHDFEVQYQTGPSRVTITLQTEPPSLNRLHWSFSASYPESETRTSNLTDTLLEAPRAVYTDISAGFDHNCALLMDGSPECWGDNSEGQSFPPHGLMLKDISAGFRFSCGLRADGTPVCWGDINRWTIPTPSDEVLVSITTGGAHACGLREDGTPVCWGRNNYRQSAPPEGEVFKMMSAGERYTCALRLDGTPMCWGNNHRGQTAAPRDEVLANIYSGVAHTCGIRLDSTPVCWGDNSHDQNWPPFSAPKPTPTPRAEQLFSYRGLDCTGTNGCSFSNIQLDDGVWRLSIRLQNNQSTAFKVEVSDGIKTWVAIDEATVDNLRASDTVRTVNVGPDDSDNLEPGRQTVTVYATGEWALTFSFARGP